MTQLLWRVQLLVGLVLLAGCRKSDPDDDCYAPGKNLGTAYEEGSSGEACSEDRECTSARCAEQICR